MTDNNSFLKGIDVSHYQGTVDWSAVAAEGIRFCFLKATEGTVDVDPMFHDNWKGAAAAGILRGAYHFFRPGQDAGRQAEHFLSVVPQDPDALPPALDIEVTDGAGAAEIQAGIHTWVQTVGAAAGRSPILYADAPFWKEQVKADFSDYPLWLACYGEQPEVPPPWQDWTFWQHASNGGVRGVPARVDLDYCALTEQQLQRLGTQHRAAGPVVARAHTGNDEQAATSAPPPQKSGESGLEQRIENDVEKARKLL